MRQNTLTQALAEFSGQQSLLKSAKEILKLSFIDWIAVALAGTNEPVAKSVKALAASEGGFQVSNVVGLETKYPPRMAAMVNGTVGHALDYDDTHFAHIGHPSSVILPAALAIAQSEGCSGEALQEAALIGVEASIRVGLWLGRDHYQAGFHQTATAGAFGAAIACARLLGLDPQQTASVIGLVSTRASGLKSQFGSMGKPFNAGLAASNAVEAALLVRNGFLPNPEGLECIQGFGDTHHGQAQLSAALDGLGATWLFETVSHKFHACCHGLHATLEAFRPLNGKADEITSIAVHTNPRWLRVCNIASPADGLECKFSYRHVLSMASHGQDTAGIASYTEASANDPKLGSFREKVSVEGDDRISETATRLHIQMTDGSERILEHDLDSPIAIEEKRARILSKATALIGATKATELSFLIDEMGAPDLIGTFISH